MDRDITYYDAGGNLHTLYDADLEAMGLVRKEYVASGWKRALVIEEVRHGLGRCYKDFLRNAVPRDRWVIRSLTAEDFGQTGSIMVTAGRWSIAAQLHLPAYHIAGIFGCYTPDGRVSRVHIGRAMGDAADLGTKDANRFTTVINHMEPFHGPGTFWGSLFPALYYGDHTVVQIEVQGRGSPGESVEVPDLRIDGLIGEPDGIWVTQSGLLLRD